LYGLGEAFGGGAEVEAYLHQVVAPRLFAAEPARLDQTLRAMFAQARSSRSASWRRAVSAVDLALWDLAGRASERPLNELLGGACRDRIRIYRCQRTIFFTAGRLCPPGALLGRAFESVLKESPTWRSPRLFLLGRPGPR
jgi:L-alanine-DL-glutamate epimerase-like enolase superfamily enzyme